MFMIALTVGMIGCSSEPKEDEISVENDSPKETVQEEAADVKTVDAKTTETAAKSTESSKPEITEETRKTPSDTKEIPAGDPMAGIVKKYEGNILTLRSPEDDMLYYFFTENAPILEDYSTESSHEAEGGSTIAMGNKVENSYRGTLDDEEHPTQAVKIVIITGE
ncbi:hypothetical protein D5281_04895 [bacterium 1xD42-62]|uniref:Uncharacterized protein n=2 Tax=Parablautia muri TaxID=2320879 RepID=A0A9X5GR43_9FIRM|nr:hypothetical protein [Parablautia muri]